MAIRAASIWLLVIHAGLSGLEAELTVSNGVAARRLAGHAAALNATTLFGRSITERLLSLGSRPADMTVICLR